MANTAWQLVILVANNAKKTASFPPMRAGESGGDISTSVLQILLIKTESTLVKTKFMLEKKQDFLVNGLEIVILINIADMASKLKWF